MSLIRLSLFMLGVMKIIVGLGNPGRNYQGTRHNVGYAVIDSLAAGPRCAKFQSRFQAQIAELIEDTEKILLVKPETFMNLSGRSVRQVMDFYQLPLTELLVVCDDINLPLGKLRVRAKGTHGGHNGLRNIQEHLGSTEYARLRIGVDAPKDDAIDHVLGRFRPGERAVIEDAEQKAAQAAIIWATRGIQTCMNQYNVGTAKDPDEK
jgi:PTH1 family peptidyl-tRNA hydrolase